MTDLVKYHGLPADPVTAAAFEHLAASYIQDELATLANDKQTAADQELAEKLREQMYGLVDQIDASDTHKRIDAMHNFRVEHKHDRPAPVTLTEEEKRAAAQRGMSKAADTLHQRAHQAAQDDLRQQYEQELVRIPNGRVHALFELKQRYKAKGLEVV